MFRWIPYTFIRIVLFLIGGILLGIYYPDVIDLQLAVTTLVGLAAFYIVCFIISRLRKKSLFNPGIIALPAVFLAGYVHVLYQTQSRNPDHFIALSDSIQYYQAVITRFAEEKKQSWKIEGHVQAVFTDEWQQRSGKIIFYFSKDDFSEPFRYGDVLLIKGSPKIVSPPLNPGEFDYKRFLAFRNIYHQHFLRKGDVVLQKNDPPVRIMKFAIDARLWADKTLKKYVTGTREQAIASALVLGVTDGLDNELLNAYAATGAMHVLAVSGLHITIIYMIILWLLKPLYRFRSGPWMLAIVSLVLLWAYAFITGLSPSVLRAVTMFSFIAFARPAGQSTNIYNTLAASAFCLLVFDPFLIMSVGFQLSYLAVLGIVYLQPYFYPLWEPKSWFLDEVWKIVSVSIAAQIATFALGILYFHQFPNYFLLSNLLVIPGSFAVLVLGIGVLVAGVIPLLAQAFGFVLTLVIKILNIVVFTVEAFPFSLIENIYISTLQAWLLISITITFILLFEHKRFYFGVVAFVLVVFFSFLQWDHFSTSINTRKFIVYTIKGHSAIDLIDRGQTYFLSDSALANDADKIRFHVRPNRLVSGVSNVINGDRLPFIQKMKGGRLIAWKEKIIIQVTGGDFVLPGNVHPDVVVIGNNAVRDVTGFFLSSSNTKIILDSSNSYFYTQRFLAQSKTKNVDVYSVSHQGAFEF